MDFKDAVNAEFENVLATDLRSKGLFQIGEWFIGKIKTALEKTTISELTKENFLTYVGEAYDKFVLPMDLPGPDTILDPLLKRLCLVAAGRIYDAMFKEKT